MAKKYLKITLILFLGLALSGCSADALAFRYHLSQGNKKYASEYYKEAQTEYQAAGASSHELKYIADNDSAIADYGLEDYDKTAKTLENAAYIYCDDKPKEYCDQLYYNLGNAYYRQGEGKDGDSQTGLWQNAVEAYKKDLAINPADQAAQENIDFITDKLKNRDNTQDQQSGDNNEQNNSNSDSGQNGQSGESGQNSNAENNNNTAGQTGENGQAGQTDPGNNQPGEENNATENPAGSGSENSDQTDNQPAAGSQDSSGRSGTDNPDNSAAPAAGQDSAGLDQETDQQVESYMQNLEQQEKNNQQYFRQNPNGSNGSSDPYADFFNDPFFANDPFFRDFFKNTPFGGQFDNNSDSNNGVDW